MEDEKENVNDKVEFVPPTTAASTTCSCTSRDGRHRRVLRDADDNNCKEDGEESEQIPNRTLRRSLVDRRDDIIITLSCRIAILIIAIAIASVFGIDRWTVDVIVSIWREDIGNRNRILDLAGRKNRQ